MRSITVLNSLGDILSHEGRVKVNTSPAYDDDVMNVMLLSGNVENGPALATPKSSKKKTYAGIARKVPVPVASATNNEACEEEEVVRRQPVLPAPNIATPSPNIATPSPARTVGALRAQMDKAWATSRLLQLEQEASNKKRARSRDSSTSSSPSPVKRRSKTLGVRTGGRGREGARGRGWGKK